MLHREPRWHGDIDLLLMVVAAAAALELGAVATRIAVDASLVPTLPPVERSVCTLSSGAGVRENTGSGPGEQVRPDRRGTARTAGLGPSAAAIPITLGASGSTAPPVGAATQPPSDDDPRVYLAEMTAVQHRQNLPLQGAVGRLQSLIATTTPSSP